MPSAQNHRERRHKASKRRLVHGRRAQGLAATLLACLLCCALGCLEISELGGLQDDTSNDYVSTLGASSDCRRGGVGNPGQQQRLAGPQLHEESDERGASGAPAVASPLYIEPGAQRFAAHDLLHFLSIQRT